MTYMHNNIFSHFLLQNKPPSRTRTPQLGESLIKTPESDFKAHLINISLIIGLIMFFLEAWET